jgi:hypothetical protein
MPVDDRDEPERSEREPELRDGEKQGDCAVFLLRKQAREQEVAGREAEATGGENPGGNQGWRTQGRDRPRQRVESDRQASERSDGCARTTVRHGG